MPLEGKASIYRSGKYKLLIHLGQAIANDSAFPFHPGDELLVRIDPRGKRLVIELER